MNADPGNDPLIPVPLTYSPGPEYGTVSRKFQGIPGIAIAPSGRIWATWYAGGTGEGPDNYVLLATSADRGATWSEPVAVVAPPGNVRSFDPTLWHDPMGRMWWIWSQSYSPKEGQIMDGRGGVWCVHTSESDSPNPKFSAPQRIANGVMMNKPTVLSTGEWAFPTAVWEFGNPHLEEFRAERFSNIIVSIDNGRSFSRRGGADIPERCFDEHMIVELRDGRLWMLVRTLYGIGQSFSSDCGRTWSPGEDSRLGGPNSRFLLHRLNSGRLLLINHADIPAAEALALCREGKTWRPRKNITARLSDDDGKTWKGDLLLDERDGVSYPDGAQDSNGLIRIIYDHERYKEGEILMAAFREEDILAGACRSPDAGLRILVNRFISPFPLRQ